MIPCTEGLLAVSCAKGSLHIQEDIAAMQFEPLADGNGARVMPIITDLWRRTQPIIRYRLNDILQLEPQGCTCGSTFRVIRTALFALSRAALMISVTSHPYTEAQGPFFLTPFAA